MSLRQFRWFNGYEGAPVTPEPASSPPFTYGAGASRDDHQDEFKMDGIAQATARDLRLLFSGRSEGKVPTKKWFTTQLHLYGIPFKKSARVSELKEALEKALVAGKCDELALPVAAVRDRLRNEYNEAFQRLEDKLFAEIEGGHADEAKADPARFVAKYFLDGRGQPDREKTRS